MPSDGHPECHPAYCNRNQGTQSTETSSFWAHLSQHTVPTQWAELSQLNARLDISKAGLPKLIFISILNACGMFALLPLLSIYHSLFIEIYIITYKQLKEIKKWHSCRCIETILMIFFIFIFIFIFIVLISDVPLI